MPETNAKKLIQKFFDFRHLAMRTTLIVLLSHLALLSVVVVVVKSSLEQLILFQDQELLERRQQYVLDKLQISQDVSQINEIVNQQRVPATLHKRVYTLIYDSTGALIASSAAPSAWDQVLPLNLPLPKGEKLADNLHFLKSTSGRSFAYLTSKINELTFKGTLVIAADHDVEDAMLIRLQKLIPLTVMVLVAISLSFSWLLFRSAILPLRKLTMHIAAIESVAKDPAMIPEELYPADFQGLVQHYNGMLKRLHFGFQRVAAFTSDIAHELRSPLNNLMGEIDVALEKKREAGEYEQVLASNREEVERLRSIVTSLLSLSQTGAIEAAQLEKLLINTELRKIFDYFSAFADEAKIKLELQLLDNEEQSIFAQKILMQQAVGNLVANAIKFTTQGGTVVITAEIDSNNSQLIISIRDTGKGISDQDLPFVFNRFYKVDSARSYNAGGTGLGLAIVKNIVERHRGSVNVSSQLGVGSVFVTRWNLNKAS